MIMFSWLKEGLFSECNFLFKNIKMSWYVSVSVHVLMSIISASPEIRSLHHGVCSIPLPGNTGNKPSHSLKFSNHGEGHYFPCWKRLLLLSYLRHYPTCYSMIVVDDISSIYLYCRHNPTTLQKNLHLNQKRSWINYWQPSDWWMI